MPNIRPYLLRSVEVTRPNRFGELTDLHPFKKGFLYLFVIFDWYSRYIVDYELSSTLEKSFVLTCLQRALATQKPEIINSDQGSHFTNRDYLKLLDNANVKISMDGKGQCLDNARTERFFRTLKYDRIYINEYFTPRELRTMLNEYMQIYNTYRPHSSLDGQSPIQYYFENSASEATLCQEIQKGA